ncbi:hypothetical protein [Mycobacterium sp.]|uniref:hypothetical protein n=1 Tax=Mycobacterium sp. TaxID=1785 RepID=UPI003F9A9E80
MKIRMKIGIAGTFHGIDGGVQRGDTIAISPDLEALRYVRLGYAEADLEGPVGPAYQPPPAEVLVELRHRVLPAKKPLEVVRDKIKTRPKTRDEAREEQQRAVPW